VEEMETIVMVTPLPTAAHQEEIVVTLEVVIMVIEVVTLMVMVIPMGQHVVEMVVDREAQEVVALEAQEVVVLAAQEAVVMIPLDYRMMMMPLGTLGIW